MTKIITMTFLLKNPARVREMVKEGTKLLVKFRGKIVMEIEIFIDQPKKNKLKVLPPSFNLGKHDFKFNREEIYEKQLY